MSVYFEVYEIVRDIPYGRVLTYGLISHMIGSRLSAQGVGWALRALSSEGAKKYNSSNVPWHRVINAAGGVSTNRNTELPPDLQQTLLEAEGIEFNDEIKIDLDRYLWKTALGATTTPLARGRKIGTNGKIKTESKTMQRTK